jgi:tetratricopeptide (TPR) repeat protein
MSPFGVVCPKCGAGMPMGVQFCGSCGARIPDAAPEASREGEERRDAPASPPRGAGVRLLVFAWALGILAGFFLGRAFAPEALKPSAPGTGAPAPENTAAILDRAHAASDTRRYSEARDLYERAIALDPGNLAAQVDLGVARIALGDPDGARAAFGAALAGASPHPAAAYNLARMAEEAGNAAEARKYYALYLKLAPEGPRAREVRSKVARAGGAK